MPAGLQLFNESGQLILDYTTHVGRFIGSFTTDGSVSGTITDARIIGGRFFYIYFGAAGGPTVTGNSSTGGIDWLFAALSTGGNPQPTSPQATVYYGVY